MADHIVTGKTGESLSVKFLQEKGYRILDRNWRWKQLELDVIAQDGGQLVFVEVKSRKGKYYGTPAEFIDGSKEKKLMAAAQAYIEQIDYEWEIRFDFIEIIFRDEQHFEINHYEDAFYPGSH